MTTDRQTLLFWYAASLVVCSTELIGHVSPGHTDMSRRQTNLLSIFDGGTASLSGGCTFSKARVGIEVDRAGTLQIEEAHGGRADRGVRWQDIRTRIDAAEGAIIHRHDCIMHVTKQSHASTGAAATEPAQPARAAQAPELNGQTDHT